MADNGKHPGGRPPIWKDPDEMQSAINAYFAKCDVGREITVIRKGLETTKHARIPYTVVGLALALGFSSRQSLHDYIDRNQHSSDVNMAKFAYVLARARAMIEDDNVTGGMTGEYEPKITGLNLASNYNYSTKSEVENKGTLTVQVINYAPQDTQEKATKDGD